MTSLKLGVTLTLLTAGVPPPSPLSPPPTPHHPPCPSLPPSLPHPPPPGLRLPDPLSRLLLTSSASPQSARHGDASLLAAHLACALLAHGLDAGATRAGRAAVCRSYQQCLRCVAQLLRPQQQQVQQGGAGVRGPVQRGKLRQAGGRGGGGWRGCGSPEPDSCDSCGSSSGSDGGGDGGGGRSGGQWAGRGGGDRVSRGYWSRSSSGSSSEEEVEEEEEGGDVLAPPPVDADHISPHHHHRHHHQQQQSRGGARRRSSGIARGVCLSPAISLTGAGAGAYVALARACIASKPVSEWMSE